MSLYKQFTEPKTRVTFWEFGLVLMHSIGNGHRKIWYKSGCIFDSTNRSYLLFEARRRPAVCKNNKSTKNIKIY